MCTHSRIRHDIWHAFEVPQGSGASAAEACPPGTARPPRRPLRLRGGDAEHRNPAPSEPTKKFRALVMGLGPRGGGGGSQPARPVVAPVQLSPPPPQLAGPSRPSVPPSAPPREGPARGEGVCQGGGGEGGEGGRAGEGGPSQVTVCPGGPRGRREARTRAASIEGRGRDPLSPGAPSGGRGPGRSGPEGGRERCSRRHPRGVVAGGGAKKGPGG